MGCILKFRLPNLDPIIILTKVKKDFSKKEERAKGFFIFMTMLSFKQVEERAKGFFILMTMLSFKQVESN